jgi:hypothetical protein
MLASLGCCGTLDATKNAAAGNTRDLRLIRDEMVDLLPADAQSVWDKRLVAFIVRGESIEAGIAHDKDFDVKASKAKEESRRAPR